MKTKQGKKEIEAIKRIDKQIELAKLFVNILKTLKDGRTSDEIEDAIIEHSAKLQRDMNQYGHGKMSYQPPFENYVIRNYEMFANLSILIQEPYSFENILPGLRTTLHGYLMFLEELKEDIENRGLEEDIQSPNISGTLENLEKILIEAIYDFVIKNPNLGTTKSRSISQSRKEIIKQRDDYICQICQEPFPEGQLEIDHILPHSLGGSNSEYNLMPLCSKCNADKGNRLTYYQSGEGKKKLKNNIGGFAKNVPMIHNFGDWLKKEAAKTHKNK